VMLFEKSRSGPVADIARLYSDNGAATDLQIVHGVLARKYGGPHIGQSGLRHCHGRVCPTNASTQRFFFRSVKEPQTFR
jgi:transposase InsO family protein